MASNNYKTKRKIPSGLLSAQDVTHARWEVIRPTAVDIPHAFVAQSQLAATRASGFYGSSLNLENARYVLVNYYVFFSFHFFGRGPSICLEVAVGILESAYI